MYLTCHMAKQSGLSIQTPPLTWRFYHLPRWIAEATNRGKSPFFVSLQERDMPTPAQVLELGAVENILMVGYPIGLWDEANVLPIIRAGITATHPAIEYGGRAEFMIDAACFGGSSGSPVFYNGGSSRLTRDGNVSMGAPQIWLLGVLWGGPVFESTGEIRAVAVPTGSQSIAVIGLHMNLGYVIKARRILEFRALLQRLAASAGQ